MTHAIMILALLLPTGSIETPHAWGKSDTFQIKSESVVYCASTGMYEFEIKFTEVPDFYTVDGAGRQNHDGPCMSLFFPTRFVSHSCP